MKTIFSLIIAILIIFTLPFVSSQLVESNLSIETNTYTFFENNGLSFILDNGDSCYLKLTKIDSLNKELTFERTDNSNNQEISTTYFNVSEEERFEILPLEFKIVSINTNNINIFIQNLNQEEYSCTDSDNGLTSEIKGEIKGIILLDNVWQSFRSEDICIPETNMLKEYYCDTNLELSHQAQSELITCEFGCNDGACVQNPTNNTSVQSPTNNTSVQSPTNNTSVQNLTNNTSIQSPTNNTSVQSPTNNTSVQNPNLKILCSTDVKKCNDGSFVSRNSNNNCEFNSCLTDTSEEITCKDSDGGINYFKFGEVLGYNSEKGDNLSSLELVQYVDTCLSDSLLREYYCKGKFIASSEKICLNGCKNGICMDEVGIIEDNNLVSVISSKDSIKALDKNLNTKNPSLDKVCSNGCIVEGKCVDFGLRFKNGEANYCGLSGEILIQKSLDESCQNNFECETNSCVSGICINLLEKVNENSNLLKKILTWLNKLF